MWTDLAPALPDAWQPRGAAIAVPTASQSRRLHVFGVLTRKNALPPYMSEGRVDTAVMSECCAPLSAPMDKRSDGLRDHAPMHRSKSCIQQMPHGVRSGVIVKYLPSDSPALNLLEMLWRFIKYYWLPLSAYTSFQGLWKAVEDILTRLGTDDTITFQTT